MEASLGLFAIAAGIAVLTGFGAGIGIGVATGGAAQGVSRQPEASGKITAITILGAALAEATAIYGFVVALIILFVKWPA
jgi:F-type H+-transporting ATPase subunit c